MLRKKKVQKSDTFKSCESLDDFEVKDLNITEADQLKPDVKVYGNGDMFQLLCKASSENQSWMKSTKAMEIANVGCVVQVTTQNFGYVAEAVTFVPGVKIVKCESGGKKLVSIHG